MFTKPIIARRSPIFRAIDLHNTVGARFIGRLIFKTIAQQAALLQGLRILMKNQKWLRFTKPIIARRSPI